MASVRARIDELAADGRIDSSAAAELIAASDGAATPKTESDVQFLSDLIERHESVAHAAGVARDHIGKAEAALAALEWLPAGPKLGQLTRAKVKIPDFPILFGGKVDVILVVRDTFAAGESARDSAELISGWARRRSRVWHKAPRDHAVLDNCGFKPTCAKIWE